METAFADEIDSNDLEADQDVWVSWTGRYSDYPCASRLPCSLGLPRRRCNASIIRVPGLSPTLSRRSVEGGLAMTKKQLRILTERLLQAKARLVRRIERNRHDQSDSDCRPVRDAGDRILACAMNNYLKGESSLLLSNLRQIEDALERIKVGTYGRCSECGKRIEKKRLSAVSWAVRCVNCQVRKETTDSFRRQKAAFRASERSRQSTAERAWR